MLKELGEGKCSGLEEEKKKKKLLPGMVFRKSSYFVELRGGAQTRAMNC